MVKSRVQFVPMVRGNITLKDFIPEKEWDKCLKGLKVHPFPYIIVEGKKTKTPKPEILFFEKIYKFYEIQFPKNKHFVIEEK